MIIFLGTCCFIFYIFIANAIVLTMKKINRYIEKRVETSWLSMILRLISNCLFMLAIMMMVIFVPVTINNTFPVIEDNPDNKLGLLIFGMATYLFFLLLHIKTPK